MSFEQVLQTIESPGYGSVIGVVSTPRAFDSAVNSSPEVAELLGLTLTPEYRVRLGNRLAHLLEQAPDAGYAHPNDLPIAVYLRVLEKTDPDAAIRVSRRIVLDAALWWSRAIAVQVLSRAATRPSRTIFQFPIEDHHYHYETVLSSSAIWGEAVVDVGATVDVPVRSTAGDVAPPVEYLMVLFDEQPTLDAGLDAGQL